MSHKTFDDCNNPLGLLTGFETNAGLWQDWAGPGSIASAIPTFGVEAGIFSSVNHLLAYRDESWKYFIWLIFANNPSNMKKPGILVFLILLGGCFPFVFSRRKHQRTRDAKKSRRQNRGTSEDGRALAKVFTDQTPYEPQESAVSPPKKQKKPTLSYVEKAAYFSGPQNLSEEDKLYQQAYRYGVR